jgi:protein-S-isoprenylcysteine O-methyltransferase Ste14
LTAAVLVAGPLYFTDRPAAFLYWGLSAVWIAVELVFYVRTLLRKGAQLRDQGSFVVALSSIFVGFVLSITLALAFPGAAVREGRAAVFAAGLAIMALGMALRFSAMLVLGRFFTVVVMVGGDQYVVDTGPYRWIRHPSYTGGLLAITGALVATTNWVELVGVLPMIAGVLYRMSVEERALSDHLGEAYRSYARRTKRLLPFVY